MVSDRLSYLIKFKKTKSAILILGLFFLLQLSAVAQVKLSTEVLNNRSFHTYSSTYSPQNFDSISRDFHVHTHGTDEIEHYYFNSTYWKTEHLKSSLGKQEKESQLDWTKFSIVTGGIAASYTGLFLYTRDRWWSKPRVPFHFNEQYYARGFDKLGHFYASKTQALIISRLYELSDMHPNLSALLGAGIALSVQTIIEIKDGTLTSGGFDRFDQLGNIMGVSWFYARERVDFLKRFNVRWMYYPSGNLEQERTYRDSRITDDYNGQSYWMSMRVWDLLPDKLQPYWPRFLVPTAGVSLNNWPGATNSPHLSYHLSVNLDFKHIIPQSTAFGRILSELLNGVHFPAPALELHPNPSFKLIFYGQD